MKRLLLLASIFLTLFVSFVAMPMASSPVLADAKSDICNGVSGAGGNCSGGSGPSLGTVVATVINILSMVVGIAAVIMIIIAGFQYVTSQGDSSKISSAKNTIIYALVGIVIVAFSQFLVKFVLHSVGI